MAIYTFPDGDYGRVQSGRYNFVGDGTTCTVGFFGKSTPGSRVAALTDAGAATSAETRMEALIDALQGIGLVATA